MDCAAVMNRLRGAFLALPTSYNDDLSVNVGATGQYIDYVIDGGLRVGNAVLLVNGASGEFPVLNLDERLRTAEKAIQQADGRIGLIVGAQTLSTLEAIEIARHAQSLGADALQVSPPFYYRATDDDVYEHLAAIAEAAPDVGIVYYNTYWEGYDLTIDRLERFCQIPQLVSVKLATHGMKAYQSFILQFRDRLNMIDNQVTPVINKMLGGDGANLHPSIFWPQWGTKTWQLLEDGAWDEAQDQVNRVLIPYYDIVGDIGAVTGGEGHIDKVALEMLGLPGGRNRPPTRPLPPAIRQRVRRFLLDVGVPGVQAEAVGAT